MHEESENFIILKIAKNPPIDFLKLIAKFKNLYPFCYRVDQYRGCSFWKQIHIDNLY